MKVDHLISDLRGAIFDMDGLLVNSEKLYEEANLQAAKEVGLDLPDTFYQDLSGTSVDFLQKFFDEHFASQAEIDAFIKRTDDLVWDWANHGRLELRPGVLATLKIFQAENIKMAVASSNYENFVARFLEVTGISEYFEFYLYFGAVAAAKPDPAIYNLAQERLDIPKENLLVFEDSSTGLLAAKRAEIKRVLVPFLTAPTASDQENADLIVASFTDFNKLLK